MSAPEMPPPEAVGILITSAHPPFVVHQMNGAAARRLGLHREAVLERALTEALPDAEDWLEAITQAYATREEVTRAVTLRGGDGRLRDVTLTCSSLVADDAPDHVLSLVSEGAPRPALGGNLLATAEALVRSLPLPAWLYDARGRLHAVNAATLALFEVPDEAALRTLIGTTLADQLARLRPRLASPASIARATEESIYTFTPERIMADGEERRWGSVLRREGAEPLRQDELPVARALRRRSSANQIISLQPPLLEAEVLVRSYATPLIDAEGRVIGALWLTIDMTGDLLQDGRRDAILALAGHDIRNPLTPARGLLQQLKLKLGKEGDRFTREMGYIDTVLAQLDRIRQISSDLDAVSVASQSEVTASMATCELVGLARTVAQHQMERHPEVPIVVKTTAEAIKGVWTRLHLERALTMLVDSAAHRTPPGRAVTLRLRQLRTQVKVEITDQGPPLAPDRLDALRTVLDRGGAALALTEGWDLDLSTVQTLLALNRSRLYVAARPRGGTTLWFALPLPRPDPIDVF